MYIYIQEQYQNELDQTMSNSIKEKQSSKKLNSIITQKMQQQIPQRCVKN